MIFFFNYGINLHNFLISTIYNFYLYMRADTSAAVTQEFSLCLPSEGFTPESPTHIDAIVYYRKIWLLKGTGEIKSKYFYAIRAVCFAYLSSLMFAELVSCLLKRIISICLIVYVSIKKFKLPSLLSHTHCTTSDKYSNQTVRVLLSYQRYICMLLFIQKKIAAAENRIHRNQDKFST